jgi:uncharacterized protein DUF4350
MSYRLELGLALLLTAAVGIAVFAAQRTPKPQEPDSRASTFLSGPEGSQALYRVMVRLGRPVERRRTALFDLASDTAPRRSSPPALVVVLDPWMPLEPAELEQVVRFVQAGGAVIAAGFGGGITRCAGWRLQPQRAFDDSVPVQLRHAAGEAAAPHAVPLRLPRAAHVLAPRARAGPLEGLVKRSVAQREEPCDTLVAEARDTLVAATNGRPVVLRLHYAGGGTITLASDVGWFRNQVWRDSDVPYVLMPLLIPARRGRVVWDEYHQGFGRESQSMAAVTWDWLIHSPAGWAILQLVAVGLVWLAVTAVRFGPARSVIERRRRSPLEHLEALAAGLESSADSETAVLRIIAGLRRRLSRAGHVGSTDLNAWLGTLALATTTPRGRGSVRRLRHLITQRGGASPERALDAAQAVEDVWEELRPRSTRDAF